MKRMFFFIEVENLSSFSRVVLKLKKTKTILNTISLREFIYNLIFLLIVNIVFFKSLSFEEEPVITVKVPGSTT